MVRIVMEIGTNTRFFSISPKFTHDPCQPSLGFIWVLLYAAMDIQRLHEAPTSNP